MMRTTWQVELVLEHDDKDVGEDDLYEVLRIGLPKQALIDEQPRLVAMIVAVNKVKRERLPIPERAPSTYLPEQR
jgi:hypothetical protein